MQNIIGLNTSASKSSAVYFNGVRIFGMCVSLIFIFTVTLTLLFIYCIQKFCLQSSATNNALCKANKFNSSRFVKYPLHQTMIQVKGREHK